MQRSPGARATFFVLDMLPRVLVGTLVVLLLGFLLRRFVGSLSVAAWNLIVTAVFAVALARVCSALLIVTAASLVGQSAKALAAEPEREVAVAMASPHFARFYMARLVLSAVVGLVLGVLLLILHLFGSRTGSRLDAFTSGVVAGVLYGYLSAGWELARAATAETPRGVAH